ncbi:hypothetical protein Angca_000929, partial [Angiostrongylus cantonensis]
LSRASVLYEVLGAKPPNCGVKAVREGDRAELIWPIFAYPEPYIEPSSFVSYDRGNLILIDIQLGMSGVHRCIANNSFQMLVGGPAMLRQLFYEKNLMV